MDLDHYDNVESRLADAVEQNVLVQLDNLRTTPFVNARLAHRDIHLHGWVYVIETGEVMAYNAALTTFTSLLASA